LRYFPPFFLFHGQAVTEVPSAGIDYELTEQDTGLLWINDKSIFQKTINFGALPNNTFKDVAHSITTIEEVIFLEGYAQNAEATEQLEWIKLGHRSSGTAGTGTSCGVTNLRVLAAGNFSVYEECHITIYYTKV